MVTVWRSLQNDWIAFRERFASSTGVSPGLYAYDKDDAGRSRVHLRVESDRRGVLFIDVTDVVHLNQTATQIAKWALDGAPRDEAWARLRGRFGWRDREKQIADLDRVYHLVSHALECHTGCPTCSMPALEKRPLFSTPVEGPYKVDLAVTYACNNDCPHCYNELDRFELESLPPQQWRSIIDTLYRVGVPHLIFTGGEATLCDFLPGLIRYADDRGMVCGLNSNGRQLAHASYARELADAGLNHVQITLASHHAEIHNRINGAKAFDQTVQGVQQAIDAGLHVLTNSTLVQMNVEHFEDTIDFIGSLGVRTFAVNSMIHSGGGFDNSQAMDEASLAPLLLGIRDKANELGMRMLWYTPTMYCRLSPVELELGAKRCNAAEYSLCVEPNGDVLPCQSYYAAAGNLLHDPWSTIWNSQLFQSFRDRIAHPREHGLPEICWDCPELATCGGGCRIQRDAEQGVRSADPGDKASSCQGCGGKRRATGQLARAAGNATLIQLESVVKG